MKGVKYGLYLLLIISLILPLVYADTPYSDCSYGNCPKSINKPSTTIITGDQFWTYNNITNVLSPINATGIEIFGSTTVDYCQGTPSDTSCENNYFDEASCNDYSNHNGDCLPWAFSFCSGDQYSYCNSNFFTEGDCNAVSGCYWDTGQCYASIDCSMQGDASSCSSYGGCSVNNYCPTNTALSCLDQGTNSGACSAVSGCTFASSPIYSMVTSDIFNSTVPNGVPPLFVVSSTLVSLFNSDLLDGYHASDIIGLIPTAVSQLTNDAGFLTYTTAHNSFYNKTEVDQNFSSLSNTYLATDGSNYLKNNLNMLANTPYEVQDAQSGIAYGALASTLNLGTNNTIAFTISNLGPATSRILTESGNSNYVGFLNGASGTLRYVFGGYVASIRTGGWSGKHRVVLTKSGANITAYDNEVLIYSAVGNPTMAVTPLNGLTRVMADSSGAGYAQGYVDEIVLLNEAKDQAWVTADYNAGNYKYYSTSENNLTNLWHFDEGTGTSAIDIKSGNNITFQATPTWQVTSSSTNQLTRIYPNGNATLNDISIKNIYASGNITGNSYYGGAISQSSSGIGGKSMNATYQSLNFSNIAEQNNGFNLINSNTAMTLNNPQGAGVYRIDWRLDEDGTTNHVYIGYIYVNEVQQNNTFDRAEASASGEFHMEAFGRIRINYGDNVTLRLADTSGTSTPTIYLKNIMLNREGN